MSMRRGKMSDYIKYSNDEEQANLFLKVENDKVVDSARDKIYADRYGHSITRNLIGMNMADVEEIMNYDDKISAPQKITAKEFLVAKSNFLKIQKKEHQIDVTRANTDRVQDEGMDKLAGKEQKLKRKLNPDRYESKEDYEKAIVAKRIKTAKKYMGG